MSSPAASRRAPGCRARGCWRGRRNDRRRRRGRCCRAACGCTSTGCAAAGCCSRPSGRSRLDAIGARDPRGGRRRARASATIAARLAERFAAPAEEIARRHAASFLDGLAERRWWSCAHDRRAPPIAMLAELTHRCPLACPYCSNPIELTPQGARARHRRPGLDVFAQAADARGAAPAPLGRRARCRAATWSRWSPARAAAGLYTNLITSGIGLTERRLDGARRGRARPRAAVAAGDRRGDGRPDRRLSRRLRAQDGGGGVDRGGAACR